MRKITVISFPPKYAAKIDEILTYMDYWPALHAKTKLVTKKSQVQLHMHLEDLYQFLSPYNSYLGHFDIFTRRSVLAQVERFLIKISKSKSNSKYTIEKAENRLKNVDDLYGTIDRIEPGSLERKGSEPVDDLDFPSSSPQLVLLD